MIRSFTGIVIAYVNSFRDLKIRHHDEADKLVYHAPHCKHSRRGSTANNSPLDQDVEAQIKQRSDPPSVLLVSMNITVFIMSLYAMAATARSYALYNGHKRDGPKTPGQRPWPDVVNFDEIKCILPISIVSLVQSAICFVTLLTTPRPGPVYFSGLSILVIAYSITIPYLWGIDVFKTGVHDSNPNLYSMLGDWACHLETEPIPFYGEICDRLVNPHTNMAFWRGLLV